MATPSAGSAPNDRVDAGILSTASADSTRHDDASGAVSVRRRPAPAPHDGLSAGIGHAVRRLQPARSARRRPYRALRPPESRPAGGRTGVRNGHAVRRLRRQRRLVDAGIRHTVHQPHPAHRHGHRDPAPPTRPPPPTTPTGPPTAPTRARTRPRPPTPAPAAASACPRDAPAAPQGARRRHC
ncbi:hypothetical protein ACRAWF_19650 [Streptomyces sp. L7]